MDARDLVHLALERGALISRGGRRIGTLAAGGSCGHCPAALSSGRMSDTASAPRTDAAVPTSGISLVLGSGGARGYAHIGVIEELSRAGFPHPIRSPAARWAR